MTIHELVTQVTAALQAEFDSTVEAYWRMEPPRALTVFVTPHSEDEEMIGIGGAKRDEQRVDAIIEIPWDDKASTAKSGVDAVETIKTWIEDNRNLTNDASDRIAQIGGWERINYKFFQRPGQSKATWGATMPITFHVDS